MTSSGMSVRDTKKNDKRKRIEKAVIEVMARNGFDRTTVSQVAKSAGVADGTIYLYFKNKEDLLLKTLDEITERFIHDGLKVVEATLAPIERIERFAELHLRSLGADEHLACIFQIELRSNMRLMRHFSESKLRQYFKYLESYISDAQSAGQIRKDINPWMTAKILFGALDKAATNWVLSSRDYRLEEMVKPTMDIILNGIRSRDVI